jgi:hypothetical protein
MSAAARPRILYVVTEDWYFLSHRLPMARAARDAGFDVHVATNIADGKAAIRAEGLVPHPVNFVRARYDAAARRLAVGRFSADAIGHQTVDLYRRLVSLPGDN